MTRQSPAATRWVAIAFLAGVGLLAGCAAPGAIGGRLRLPAASSERASDGSSTFGAQEAVISVISRDRWEPGKPAAAKSHAGKSEVDKSDVGKSEVGKSEAEKSEAKSSAKSAAAEPAVPPAKCAVIVHTAHGFEPHVLPVAVGTKVVFKNRDQVYHQLFSISPAKSFALGSQAPGERASVTFDSVGVVTLHCELHPEATGFVVVLPTEQFTQPNAQGQFMLSDLTPGTYTIAAWHPTYGELKRRVKVPKGGQLDIGLAY